VIVKISNFSLNLDSNTYFSRFPKKTTICATGKNSPDLVKKIPFELINIIFQIYVPKFVCRSFYLMPLWTKMLQILLAQILVKLTPVIVKEGILPIIF
jgi:hypothetical protein